MKKIYILFFFLISIQDAFSLMELGGNFAYRKQNFGQDLKNNMVSRTYNGSIAVYFYDYTALEVNYASIKEVTTTYDENIIEDSGYTVVGSQSTVDTKVYGVGLKQSFAPRKAFLVPSLSLGYAKQFVKDHRDFTYRKDASGATIISIGKIFKRRIDSMFGTFSLKFRLTQLLSLTASIYTLFPAGEYNKAKDNLRYMAGFTWYF